MRRFSKPFDGFLWLLLIVNPLLDVATGVYIRTLELSIGEAFDALAFSATPGLYLRAGILALFLLYTLLNRDRRSLFVLTPIFITWVLTMLTAFFILGSLNLLEDVKYMARFIYNLMALLIYGRLFERQEGGPLAAAGRLDRIIRYTVLLLSATIVLSYCLKIGYSTYADRFGFRGARGFFYSGNDITAVLMLLLPLSLWAGQRREPGLPGQFVFPLAPALAVTALCLIGTKTAFIAVIVSLGAALIHALVRFIRKKDKQPLLGLGIILLFFVLLLLALAAVTKGDVFRDISYSFRVTGSIAETEDVQTALLSGRQHKLREAFSIYRDGGPLVWLFGTGRGLHERIIEMDLFEALFYYGIIGAAAMLWFYIRLILGYAAGFFKGFREGGLSGRGLAALVSLALGGAYLLLAGHVLFSVTSGFYFALVILYARLCPLPHKRDEKKP